MVVEVECQVAYLHLTHRDPLVTYNSLRHRGS